MLDGGWLKKSFLVCFIRMWFYANKTLTIGQSGRAVPRHVWVLIHKCLITGVMTNRLKREWGGTKRLES